MHELEGRVDVDGYEGGLVAVAVVIAVDVSRVGHVAAAGAGAVAIVDAVVVVVRIFCVEGRSWWTKTAGGAGRVRGDSREGGIAREGSDRGKSGCAEQSLRHRHHSPQGRGRGRLCGAHQWGRR